MSYDAFHVHKCRVWSELNSAHAWTVQMSLPCMCSCASFHWLNAWLWWICWFICHCRNQRAVSGIVLYGMLLKAFRFQSWKWDVFVYNPWIQDWKLTLVLHAWILIYLMQTDVLQIASVQYSLLLLFLFVTLQKFHWRMPACKTESAPYCIIVSVISWRSMWSIPLLCSTWTSKSLLSFALQSLNYYISEFCWNCYFYYLQFIHHISGNVLSKLTKMIAADSCDIRSSVLRCCRFVQHMMILLQVKSDASTTACCMHSHGDLLFMSAAISNCCTFWSFWSVTVQ